MTFHPDDERITWRISNGEFSAVATAFLLEPPSSGKSPAHMITAVGPETSVRSITAYAVGRMSSTPAVLRATDPEGRLIERFDISKASQIKEDNNYIHIEWARPTPLPLALGVWEATAYSRLMEIKYVPTDNPGYRFIATADDPHDLPMAYYRWARTRLPAPILPEWAEAVYQQGIAQGQIVELESYGIAGALNLWKPEDLRETIRVMGIIGAIKRPDQSDVVRADDALMTQAAD